MSASVLLLLPLAFAQDPLILQTPEDTPAMRLPLPFKPGLVTCVDPTLAVIEVHGAKVNLLPAPDRFGETTCQGQSGPAFLVRVTPVDDPPRLTLPEKLEIEEDQPVDLPGFAGIAPGGWGEVERLDIGVACSPGLAVVTLDPTGTVHARPAPGAFGEASCVVTVADALAQTTGRFTLRVLPVDDLPELVISEDERTDGPAAVVRPGWARVSAGAGESEPVDIQVSVERPDLFSAPPRLDPDGTLRYTPTGARGRSAVRVRVSDSAGQVTEAAFVLRVGRNLPPTFELTSDAIQVDEDSPLPPMPGFVAKVSPGEGEEDQGIRFLVEPEDPTLFAEPPAIDTRGALALRLAPDRWGTTRLVVRCQDDGGGDDTSPPQYVTVDVRPVNDRPTVEPGAATLELTEGAGPQSLGPERIRVSPGAGESGEVKVAVETKASQGFFVRKPTWDTARRSLEFQPSPDATGSAELTLRITDPQGASTSARVQVNVLAVNDPPRFTAGAPLRVTQPSVRDLPWATAISPGPADEKAQRVRFLVKPENPADFAEAPVIQPDGRVSFTLSPTARGEIGVSVRLQDNGGTERGGSDVSPYQRLVIQYGPAAAAPEDTRHAVEGGDWLSTVARDYYGEEGVGLVTYLCAYNQERGRVQDCDWIEPDEEVLLPPIKVLRCRLLADLGQACPSSRSEDVVRMLNTLPPPLRACTEQLQAAMPSHPPAMLVALAKAVADEVDPDSQAYLGACKAALVKKNGFLELPRADYFTLDEQGRPLIQDYWGPEDN